MADIKIEAKNEFLNKEGLRHYDEKIKGYINEKAPQGDWEQTDSTKADYIKNKPELGALAVKDEVAKADLAADVQVSLNKADTAIQSLNGYATESFVSLKVAENDLQVSDDDNGNVTFNSGAPVDNFVLAELVQSTGESKTAVMSQKAVTDRFADISADEKVVIDSTAPFTDGRYILNDGTIADGGGSWFITDFIAVEPYKVIGFTLKGFNNWGDIVLDTITFYDKDKNRIGGFSPKSNYNGAWSTQLVIPDGCEFIKCMHDINDAFTPYVCLAKETISVPLDDSTLMENQDVFKFNGSIWQSSVGRFYKTAQIRCEGFTSVSFHLSAFHSASDGIGLQSVTFLDENGNYINGANCAIHDLCIKDVIQTVPIPEGAKWMYGFHMPEIDYEPYIKLNYIENGVTNIVCIGDSLTEGYTADNVILKENYPNKLQEKLGKGYTVLNQGVGGSFANTWWSNHKQYLRINDREVDIILIMLGGNYGLDDTFETAVDPYDDYNDYGDTVSGNTCKLIEWLQEQAPSAQIVMLTPTFADATKVPNNAQYMDNQCKYMPKITERYHLPVIDVRNLHGINKRNCNNFLASDGLHGTAEFYSRLGTIVANQLRSIQSV